jgi:pSer/pThr/pTyr-binding forkhead associated (FHA) protein
MNVRLVSNDPWFPVLDFTVDRFPLIIGRNGKSDLAIDNRWISDCHCELSWIQGRLTVRDLMSTHGTYINGESVTESQLQPGDTLMLGIRSFCISCSRAASPISSHDPARPGRSKKIA